MKKERSSGERTHVWRVTNRYYNGTTSVSTGSFKYTPDYELIVSDEPKFKRFGNCYHVKKSVRPCLDSYSGRVHSFGYDDPKKWGTRDGNDEGRLLLTSIPANLLPSLSESLFDEWAAEAFTGMAPTMTTGFSGTNFLLELTDFKSMFEVWSKKKGFVSNLASGHLNLEFGWKPFLRDLSNLYDGLVTWQRRLNELKSKVGKMQVRHWRKSLDQPVSSNEDYSLEWLTPPVYNATMKFTYSLPDLTEEQLAVRSLLDTMGLHLNAAVVWEAIPFSFAVDWFFGVGDYLDQFSHDWVEPEVKIIDFCSSVKWEVVLRHHDIVRSPSGTYCSTENNGSTYDRFYQRKRHLPGNYYAVSQSHRFGWKQLSLSSSLFLSRR